MSCGLKDILLKLRSINESKKTENNKPIFLEPRVVQLYCVLRLAYQIQFGSTKLKDGTRNHSEAIAEVQTGEGKSLVIALTALLLASKPYKRKVDIITSNIELAERDQQEFEKYFKCFEQRGCAGCRWWQAQRHRGRTACRIHSAPRAYLPPLWPGAERAA